MTLTPAYGRDYKSKKEVEEALAAGKDFVVQPDGSYINYAELPRGSHQVRYAKLKKVCVIKKP